MHMHASEQSWGMEMCTEHSLVHMLAPVPRCWIQQQARRATHGSVAGMALVQLPGLETPMIQGWMRISDHQLMHDAP